jgi:hypothetical protein
MDRLAQKWRVGTYRAVPISGKCNNDSVLFREDQNGLDKSVDGLKYSARNAEFSTETSTERQTKIIRSRGMEPIRSKVSINDTVLEHIKPNN